VVLAEFGTGQFFWSLIWLTVFFIWIWLLFTVFADIFRSHDLGGVAKALWVIFVIFAPYLGVFVYLIARGNKMQQHAGQRAQQKAGISYESASNEIDRLEQMRKQGLITDADFAAAKAKVLQQ
jgi:Phospholipase_D-nuclease N-terminal/Short C-terminal domain